MARLNAPLMSLDASGSVAGALTFSKWKGRNYVRQLVRPSNPKSPGQISVRAMFAFLAQNWAAITSAKKDTWDELANADSVSDFNAYMAKNQAAWRNFLPPSMDYPQLRTGSVGTLGTQSITAGVRELTINLDLAAALDNWGVLIFRSLTTGFTPSFSNLVMTRLADVATALAWTDTPLAPATYFYRMRPFTNTGLIGTAFAEISGTAT